MPQDTATLDPRYTTRSVDVKITRLVHAGLFGLDPTSLEPTPLVAQSAKWLDARRLQISLRPGLRFHSGTALTSRDVCSTIDALRRPELQSPHRPVVAAIAKCLPQGPHSLQVELGEARATLQSDLELPILRADEAALPPRPAGNLDGLGPYRITRLAPGEVTLEPSNTGLVPLPERGLVVRTVRDENARALRLLAGRSDIAPNAISPTLIPALEAQAGLSLTSRPGANVTYLLFHNERSPFDRAQVRRAVAQSIDRELIVRTLYAGRATAAKSLLPPGFWAYPENASSVPLEPDRARAAFQGVRPVSVLSGTDRARLVVARAIAQMLRDAGLTVDVVALDFGVLLARLDRGDFDMAILQMPEITEPNVLRWFFHPAGVPGEGGEGKNRARYRSPRAAELLDKASASSDRNERKQLYGELAELMTVEMPAVPLWHEDQVSVVSQRASGFRLSAEGRWLDVAALR